MPRARPLAAALLGALAAGGPLAAEDLSPWAATPVRFWSPAGYPRLRAAQEAAQPVNLPGPGRPPWRAPARVGAAVLELGDGHFWAIGGWDPQWRATNRTWVYVPEPFERHLREPARHPGGFWKEGPRMHRRRAFAAVCLLTDGRILVAGGYDEGGAPQRHAEVLDPRTGRCRRVDPMTAPRAGAAVVRLKNGRVLLAGGYRHGNRPTATLETYDPALEGFVEHPWRLPVAVAFPAAARLDDGDVLLTGGWTGDRPSDQMVLLDDIGAPVHPWQGVSRHPLARGALRLVGHLAGPRAGHRMRTMGEVVLIAGGTVGEPCAPTLAADPPEVWDTARPGPESAFEPLDRLDARYPRWLPYEDGQAGERWGVGVEWPDCPDLSPGARGAMLPCWVFPREARDPQDGRLPWDGRLTAEGRTPWGRGPDQHALPEPRDRGWPMPASAEDPRPAPPSPGYHPLPRERRPAP